MDVWEIHHLVASGMSSIGDLAFNWGMCCDQLLNQWPFNFQTGAQSPETHQPGRASVFVASDEWSSWNLRTYKSFKDVPQYLYE